MGFTASSSVSSKFDCVFQPAGASVGRDQFGYGLVFGIGGSELRDSLRGSCACDARDRGGCFGGISVGECGRVAALGGAGGRCGVRLLPVPMLLLRLAGRALGKQAEIDRLVGSLQVVSGRCMHILGLNEPLFYREKYDQKLPPFCAS